MQRRFCALWHRALKEREKEKAAGKKLTRLSYVGLAREAGAKNSDHCYRWRKLPKIQKYMEILEHGEKALVKRETIAPLVVEATPEEIAVDRALGGIMEEMETQELLTYHARGSMEDFIRVEKEETQMENGVMECRSYPVFDFEKAAARGSLGLIRRLRLKGGFTPEGMPWTETQIELYDAQAAAAKMAQIHGLLTEGAPKQSSLYWKDFLANLSPELKKQIWLAQMRASGEPVEVPRVQTVSAKVVGGHNGSGGTNR